MSKFDLPGAGSKWGRIGRKSNSIPKAKSDDTFPNQITYSYGIPTAINNVFAVGRRSLQLSFFVPALIFVPLAAIALAFNRTLSPMFFVAIVFFVQAWRIGLGRRSARRECAELLKQRSAGDTRKAGVLFYGLPKGVFALDRLYWDVGLVEACGGLWFEGTRHTFALRADQITRSQWWPSSGSQSELLEIEWCTPEDNRSSIFIMEPTYPSTTLPLKKWVEEVKTGSQHYDGPLPIDCTSFTPFKTGKSWIWQATLAIVVWGGCAFAFSYWVHPNLEDDKNVFFTLNIAIVGAYTSVMMFLFNAVQRASSLADESLSIEAKL
ncbi:MAG TPA: hypothetical protein VK171_12380 [Fimbriimonas sp.]|nr:hypothetical protein [Fimbriimonas sp.]